MRHLYRAFALAIVFSVSIWPSGSGTQTVSTCGTPVQLVTTGLPIQAQVVTIQAKSTNTGTIFVGFTPAVNAANKIGVALGPPITSGQPGGAWILYPTGNAAFWQLGEVYLDCTAASDGVSYTWK